MFSRTLAQSLGPYITRPNELPGFGTVLVSLNHYVIQKHRKFCQFCSTEAEAFRIVVYDA